MKHRAKTVKGPVHVFSSVAASVNSNNMSEKGKSTEVSGSWNCSLYAHSGIFQVKLAASLRGGRVLCRLRFSSLIKCKVRVHSYGRDIVLLLFSQQLGKEVEPIRGCSGHTFTHGVQFLLRVIFCCSSYPHYCINASSCS